MDPNWQDVAIFLGAQQADDRRVMAPPEFRQYLPRVRTYSVAGAGSVDELDFAVIHKGMVGNLPVGFYDAMLAHFRPVFANTVFVVFGRSAVHPAPGGHDVLPIYAALKREFPNARLPLGFSWRVRWWLAALPERSMRAARRLIAFARHPGGRLPILTVYLGNDLMLCRTRDWRKITLPARPSAVLSATTGGQNLVEIVRHHISPAVAGAINVLDYGAGAGLFILAAKTAQGSEVRFIALESEDILLRCLVANVDLSAALHQVEFVNAGQLPSKFQPRLASGDPADAMRRVWAFEWPDASDFPVHTVHFDLAYPPPNADADPSEFLASQGHPNIILSANLSARAEPPDAAWSAHLRHCLTQSGYLLDRSLGPDLPPGVEITLARHLGRTLAGS